MGETSENLIDIESRKGDHIRLCLDERSQSSESVFAKYRLPYTALPETSMKNVDISAGLPGKTLQAPLIIASMTGGSEHGRAINTNLALAAEHCGVAMGLGSQRIGLEKADAEDTFRLARKNAPNTFLFANMGAVQLNYGHGIDSYRRVVDMIQADALYLHLNPLQEALQPGGDTDFSGLLASIADLVSALSVPVFIKEVGHGISGQNAVSLFEAGVAGIDVAGVGGTSYAWVEAERAGNNDYKQWFKDFGIPTDTSIKEVAPSKKKAEGQYVVASGGVRSPVDGLKARVLGADLFSAAAPFLRPAMESPEAVIEAIDNWKQGLRIAMFTSGAKNWKEAKSIEFQSLGKHSS